MAARKRRAPQAKKPARKKRKKKHPNLGGARPGAGRKPVGARAGVAHRARPRFTSKDFVHVSFRVLEGLPDLASAEVSAAVTECVDGAPRVPGFRVERLSVRSDHAHLVVKARSRPVLAAAMQGLGVRLARRLNAMWGRKGTIFADRYDAEVLNTPAELERVLAVLRSARCGMRGRQRCPSARPAPAKATRKRSASR